MEKFCETSHTLIWCDKSTNLDLHVKLYLGIMAASCYNCTYLLNILEA